MDFGIRTARLAIAFTLTYCGFSTAAADEIELVYRISFAGLPAATMRVVADITANSYRIVSEAKSRGPMRLLYRFRSRSESSGTIEDGALRPVRYKREAKFGRRPSSVILEYSPDGAVTASIVPTAEEEDREAVPADDIPGTLDPTTATFLGLAGVGNSVPCSQSMAVFDGRQRYDMVVGTSELAKPSGYELEGLALRCNYERVPISGDFDPPEGAPTTGRAGARGPSFGQVWFARVAGTEQLVPVRMESGSGLQRLEVVLESVGGGELADITDR